MESRLAKIANILKYLSHKGGSMTMRATSHMDCGISAADDASALGTDWARRSFLLPVQGCFVVSILPR